MIKREREQSHSTPHTEGPNTPDVKHIMNPDVLHELSDVNTKPIFKFGFWMIVIIAGTAVMMWFFFDMLSARDAKNDAPKPVIPNTMSKLPPEPRLQLAPGHEIHPLTEMAEMKAQQRVLLTGYGWVDKGTNTVRVPITEAKRMLLAQGLPIGGAADAASAPSDTAGGAKKAPAKAAAGDPDWKYGRAVPSGQSGGRMNEWHR